MKKRVWDFHPEARKELYAAANIYNAARPGLGEAFADAADAKLALAAQLPVPGSRVQNIGDEMVRQVFLRPRFPYRIVLVIDVSVVLAGQSPGASGPQLDHGPSVCAIAGGRARARCGRRRSASRRSDR